MADQVISTADLSRINRSLGNIDDSLRAINGRVEAVNSRVGVVEQNVNLVESEVAALARDFHDFVQMQVRANEKANAQQRLIQIRQELEKKYGHYDVVRRTATGVLQANDLGIISRGNITNVTEDLMITTPNYWLAPCLVALAAWINDEPTLAERALLEGLRRNDEKTSLFFALVCRRADRKAAALKWTQRYLANQDEENLDRKTVIILDAYASGLLGSDSEGLISKQMDEWMTHLVDKPGFVEKQTEQWSDAINLKRKPVDGSSYTYLSRYSKTWPALQDIMEGAELHAVILDYFTQIFEQEASTEPLKVQLDEILTSLVSEFDDEELPLRKEERLNQFIVEFEGDKDRAAQHMDMESSAFEEHKDFTQLLTDAAMKPESSHASVSTQKFAIALSKEWISNAYRDVTAQNRAKIPHEIEINVDTFNDKTTDGQDETAILARFNQLVDKERDEVLATCVLSGFENFCKIGGLVVAILGILMIFIIHPLVGIAVIIAGIAMYMNHTSKKKAVEQKRQNVIKQFDEKRTNGIHVIRVLLAEIVDFRAEFEQKDKQSQKVIDFLDQISPDQYVRKLADSNRRINVGK